MRTIKFKAKCVKDGSWTVGDLNHVMNYMCIKPWSETFTVRSLIRGPSVSSPASRTRTARRFMKATCCSPTPIRSVAPKTMRITIITARYAGARKRHHSISWLSRTLSLPSEAFPKASAISFRKRRCKTSRLLVAFTIRNGRRS